MSKIRPKYTLLMLFLLQIQAVYTQEIFYIYRKPTTGHFAISKINPKTCVITDVVDILPPTDATVQTFTSIAFAPDGNLYATETKIPLSKGISKIDLISGNCTRILDLPLNYIGNSMTCSEDYTIYWGAINIFSYNILNGTLKSLGGPLPLLLAGDLTFRNGKLLGAADMNTILEINLNAPEQSVELFDYTTDPNFSAFGIVSYAPTCDNTTTYITANENVGTNPTGKLYKLDFTSQLTQFLCDLPYGALDAAIKNEYNASFCDVSLNLDPDTSTLASPTDYNGKPVCLPGQIFLADTSDAILRSGYHIDSLHIALLPNPDIGAGEWIAPLNASIPGLILSLPDPLHANFYNNSGSISDDNVGIFNQIIRQMVWKADKGVGSRQVQWVVFASNGQTDTAHTNITILPANFAGSDQMIEVCSNGLPFSLNSALSGDAGTNGVWYPAQIYDPQIASPGVFVYTVDNGICQADTARIQVIENPAPVFDLGSDLHLCAGQTQILIPYGAPGNTYSWSTGSQGSSIQVQTAGIYWAEATNAKKCHWVDTIRVILADTFRIEEQVSVCKGKKIAWHGLEIQSDTNVCVHYSSVLGCDSIRCLSATFSLLDTLHETDLFCGGAYIWYGDTLTQAGRYQRVLHEVGMCDQVLVFNLADHTLPAPKIVGDTLLCAGETSSLELAGGYSTYSWSTGDKTNKITVNSAGIYAVTVSESSGCIGADSVKIDVLEPISYVWRAADASCVGYSDGSIWLDSIRGGFPPYQFRIDGSGLAGNPYFTNLSAGIYQIEVSDQKACTVEKEVEVGAPSSWDLDLGPSVWLAPGLVYTIPLSVTGAPFSPLSYAWRPSLSLSCTNCAQPQVMLQSNESFEVTVTDGHGCTQSGIIALNVRDTILVYVPNIFYPNGSAENAEFRIFGRSESAMRVDLLQIFDRWGAKIFEKRDFSPQDKDAGWDGMIEGKEAATGVYVWRIRLRLPDGTVAEKRGEFTLMR